MWLVGGTATEKDLKRPEASAVESTGYLLVSARLDGHTGPHSPAKRHLIASLKSNAAQLRRDLFANVGILTARHLSPQWPYRAQLTAGPPPATDPDQVGGYDVAVLLQAPTVESAQWLAADPAVAQLLTRINRVATGTHVAVISNARRTHCEYGAQSRELYVLMNYLPDDDREVVPAWGWTHRREMLADLAFSPALRRFRQQGARGRSVLYGLA